MWKSVSISFATHGGDTYRLRVERWDLPSSPYPEYLYGAEFDAATVERVGGPEYALALILKDLPTLRG